MIYDNISVPEAARPTWPPQPDLHGYVSHGDQRDLHEWAARNPTSRPLGPWAAVATSDSVGKASNRAGSLFFAGSVTSETAVDRDEIAAALLSRFERGGLSSLSDVTGLASMVVWDDRTATLHLIRHPYGVPTIFYRRRHNGTEWATRLDALIEHGDENDPDVAAQFLRFGRVMAPVTMIKGIMRVVSGHRLTFGDSTCEEVPMWLPDWKPLDPRPKANEVLEELESRLQASIGNWLRLSEQPPAILMSGGIDSAGLAAALVRHGRDDLVGYTVTFEGDHGAVDEYEDADAVTKHLGIRHERLTYRPEFIGEHFRWLAAWYGEPIGYGVHTAQLGPIHDAGHDTVFAGTGPDFLYNDESLRRWAWLTRSISRDSAMRLATATSALRRVRGMAGLHRALRYAAMSRTDALVSELGPHGPDAVVRALMGESGSVTAANDLTRRFIDNALDLLDHDDIDQMRAFVWSYLSNPESGILWIANWANAYAARAALPYVERSIPALIRGMDRIRPDKGEFRELATRSLPRELAFKAKIGQGLPLQSWFAGPLRDLIDDHLLDARAVPSFLDPGGVRAMIAEHDSGQVNHSWLIWKLLSLAAWEDVVQGLAMRSGSRA